MPLDPDAETLLGMIRAAGRPPMETLSPDEARKVFAAGRAVTQPDPQDVAEVRDLTCPGPGGKIPLRAYRPIGTKADEVVRLDPLEYRLRSYDDHLVMQIFNR